MAWSNGALTLYHGTNDASATAILSAGASLAFGRSYPDFGRGFYTTTYEHQARQWANQRVRLLAGPAIATVIAFTVDRTALGQRLHLAFVADTADFYDLVQFSRTGSTPPHGCNPCYDVVYGPVSLWPQTLVIKDCDQISFHTASGLGVLSGAARHATGNPLF